jgi:hypothetical protein
VSPLIAGTLVGKKKLTGERRESRGDVSGVSAKNLCVLCVLL